MLASIDVMLSSVDLSQLCRDTFFYPPFLMTLVSPQIHLLALFADIVFHVIELLTG